MNSFAVIVLVLSLPTATGWAFEGHVDAKKVFAREQCGLCHSVSSQGIEAKTTSDKLKGPDLVDLAKTYEADWIVKYIKKEADKDGKSHTKPFKGSDEELQVLVDWLLEQKSE